MTRAKKRKPTFTERVSLGLRVSPHIKERLDEAAKQSGRSQSTEAAYRLERSFERQDLLTEVMTLAFDREPAGLVLMLEWLMDTVGTEHALRSRKSENRPESWVNDPNSLEVAILAGIAMLAMARPLQSSLQLQEAKDTLIMVLSLMEDLGTEMPTKAPKWVKAEHKAHYPTYAGRIRAIRDLLGPHFIEALRPQDIADIAETLRAFARMADDVHNQYGKELYE